MPKDDMPKKFPKIVIDALAEDNGHNEEAILLVEAMRKERENTLYSDLIYTLTHLHFKEHEARHYWEEILKHKVAMSLDLKRKVGVRVAILDFFTNMHQKIDNPKIIELDLYEQTLLSSVTDGLTGLYNHRFFHDRLEEETERARRYKTPLSVVLYDIDDFKVYNDTNGHIAGDVLLLEAAKLIRKTVRRSDIPSRYGGDEMGIILPHTDKAGAYIISDRIRERVYNHHFPNQEILPLGQVSMSGGVATFPMDAADKTTLIEAADHALYQSKESGKNRVIQFNPLFQESESKPPAPKAKAARAPRDRKKAKR